MKAIFIKTTFIVAAIFMLTTDIKAQDFKDKFFFSNGFSIFTEAFFGRKVLSPYAYDINSGLTDQNVESYQTTLGGWSYFTYTPNFRYNLTEFDKNSSLSVNVPVGVGLMFSEYGFGHINLPIYIAYNMGNISTYSADQNKGFTIGLGFEYYNMALFKNSDYDGYSAALDGSNWVEPTINIGYRYWNSKNVAREFNLKLGFGPSDTQDVNGVTVSNGSAFVAKLTWFTFSKY